MSLLMGIFLSKIPSIFIMIDLNIWSLLLLDLSSEKTPYAQKQKKNENPEVPIVPCYVNM